MLLDPCYFKLSLKICLTERKRFYQNVSISQGEGECLKIGWPFCDLVGYILSPASSVVAALSNVVFAYTSLVAKIKEWGI